MEIVHSLAQAASALPSIVTIGNFDGVHRGHRAILETVVRRAKASGTRAVAVTFDPHPLRLIAPDRAPVPICTLDQRIRLISDSAIDLLLIQEFDAEFRRLSPEAFIETVLVATLRAECVCVGANFRFGHGHSGNVATLRQRADAFDVVEVPPLLHRNLPISSSRIRQGVSAGEMGSVRRMLGRYYTVAGTIVGGTGRGRRLTVPTINLEPRNELIPADGVYLTRIAVDGGAYRDAVTNVGVRPTFEGSATGGARSIETHVLDSSIPARAHGANLRFLKRLRDERRFAGAGELREQIDRDIAIGRRFFRRAARIPDDSAVGCTSSDDA